MPNIATAYVQIVPTAQGISGDLKSLLDAPASEAGASAGASAGSGFSKGLGTALKVGVGAAAAFGTALVGATGAVVKGAKDVAAYGDNVDKMSQKIGISAEGYQKWSYVMDRAGTSIDLMKQGMKTLSNAVDDESDAFERIGLSMDEVRGMSQEDLFGAVISQLSSMEAGTERTALATELLGRAGSDLGPLLNQGSEAIAEQMQMAEDYGMVMSDSAVAASAAFQDSMTTLQGTITGLKNDILSEFLPSMTQVTDGLALIFSGDTEAGLESVKAGVDGFIASFSAMIPMILEIGGDILMAIAQGILDTLPQLTVAAPQIIQSLINFITNNLPQIVAFALQIILALVSGIIQALPQLVKAVPQIIQSIVNTLKSNGPQMMSAGRTLLEFVKSGILAALNGLANIGMNIVQGIWSGISNGLGWIKAQLTGWIGNVKDFIKSLFGIASPSKWARDVIGSMIPAGIAVGIEANTDLVDGAMRDLQSGMVLDMPVDVNGTLNGAIAPQNNVSVVIYAHEGQSVKDLYNEFERRLTNSVLRREAAFA